MARIKITAGDCIVEVEASTNLIFNEESTLRYVKELTTQALRLHNERMKEVQQ